ncbi:DMT family transporter [Marinomonas primoryensis]|uniref:DMT (Drug/metabolite transporter) family transporter n=1 Tax=Marinomonas primoryensis TaxID=178399 RepID=A0A859CU60_9GAMM|nr:DMT family transporter [Marinomonas primoryensis]QKK79858.1 DMT (drug/metabolite transporter) family transporter [Marinomonas primoryensis]
MLRCYLALLLLGVIWGSNFIFMKWSTALISPMQTVMLRVIFGFIPLLVVAWYSKQLKVSQLKHLFHFAVMSVLATTFYYYGFVAGTTLIPTSVAGLLSGSIPIFTFISAFLFLRKDRPTLQMFIGVIMGFIGIVVSARPWEGAEGVDVVGVMWMLAGTTSLGVSFVYAQRQLSPLKLPPLTLATWQTGCASLTLLILTDFSGITSITSDLKTVLGVVIGLGVLGTGGAFFLYYYAIEKLGSVKASGATYIAPVVAVIIGAFVGEDMNSSIVVALVLILGGVILIQTGGRKASLS